MVLHNIYILRLDVFSGSVHSYKKRTIYTLNVQNALHAWIWTTKPRTKGDPAYYNCYKGTIRLLKQFLPNQELSKHNTAKKSLNSLEKTKTNVKKEWKSAFCLRNVTFVTWGGLICQNAPHSFVTSFNFFRSDFLASHL